MRNRAAKVCFNLLEARLDDINCCCLHEMPLMISRPEEADRQPARCWRGHRHGIAAAAAVTFVCLVDFIGECGQSRVERDY